MSQSLNIVMAQLNLVVGDIAGNLEKHIIAAKRAREEFSADIIVFPELSLTAYPPEDLLLRESFIHSSEDALQTLMTSIKDIYCLVGHPHREDKKLLNTCSLIYNGKILGRYAKQHLPNYGVFDEARYFKPGHDHCIVNIKDIPVGIIICEDLWSAKPTQIAVKEGAQLILVPNASPFETNKHERRTAILTERAKKNAVPIIYTNMVGGQDELIFDGGSMAVNAQGEVQHCAGFFNEVLHPVTVSLDTDKKITKQHFVIPDLPAKIYEALVLGTRDYIQKNYFPGALVGVSGGIDSALTLAIAVDAIGKDNVKAVLMPSRFTANISIDDAVTLIHNLDVKSEIISIEPAYQAFLDSLAPAFADRKPNVAEENIQARCRAILLMALSNKFGELVLTTGNRSEYAVGYCTLYGDMAGGYAVLKDVYKTMVYQLSEYRNRIKPVIPQSILDRPPTAELAPDQKDEDTLPPYALLDKILHGYLDLSMDQQALIAQGFDKETVRKVVNMIRKNEYKRRQAAIGARINHKSFGRDWRYPLTNVFKG